MAKSGPPVGITDKQEETRRLLKTPVIWKLRLEGLTIRDIAKEVKVPLRTVERWMAIDKEDRIRERIDLSGIDLELELGRLDRMTSLAMRDIETSIEVDITFDNGKREKTTELVERIDTKVGELLLKVIKERSRLLGLGVKDTAAGEGTLEDLLLQSLLGREVKVIEGEIVEEKDDK